MMADDFARCVAAFEAEFDYVYHALRRHGVVESDVEDLVQEVFLVMWRRWAQYDTSRPIRPWLGGIAFRVAYNHRQRAGREVPRGFVDVEDHSPDPEQSIASDSARTLVRRVLAALPEKHRSLIVSHDVDGVSVREIAETLEVPIPTAHTRLRAARKAFAKTLKRMQTVSATRARLAPLLRGEQQAALPPSPAGTRRRAIARGRAVALLPGLGLGGGARSGRAGLRRPSGGLWKAWVPVAGSGLMAGVGLLVALSLGGPAAGSVASPASAPLALVATQASLVTPGGRPLAPRRAQTVPTLTSLAALPAAWPRFQAPPPPAPAEATLGQGMVGYWRFDDGYGSASARDLSGNGNDCFLRRVDAGSAWVEGRLGGAVSLNGVGWLECPRVEAVSRLSREITIALWVKRGPKDRVRALVSRQFGSGALDTFHFGFRDDQLWMRSRVKGGPAFAPVPRSRGHWYHVASTVDASGTARIYVGGDEVTRKWKEGRPTLGGGSNPLIIGGGVNGPDPAAVRELFQGALDELVIYDRALAPDEIRALASGAQPRLSP
jgi:RNA polymerase sigma-70 factor, ECF subfamily